MGRVERLQYLRQTIELLLENRPKIQVHDCKWLLRSIVKELDLFIEKETKCACNKTHKDAIGIPQNFTSYEVYSRK